MAAIRETLTLEDKFSKTFLSFITLAERSSQGVRVVEQANLSAQQSAAGYAQTTRAAGEALGQQAVRADRAKEGTQALEQAARSGGQALKGLGNEAARQGRQAEEAAQKSQRHARAMKEASRAADQLSGKLRSLVGAYLGLRGLKGVLELSDTLSQTDARLNMMNDGLQSTAQLNDMIYRSAQRARGSYLATADLVGKLGNLAGEAFGSPREIVAFAEQINKQIALSGASAAGAQGALLQLTQALSSGVLRGEELNSILEQTPTIAKTIADYLGLSTGEMRELASEGAITAQVVKDAMFAAAEETNRKFAQMPMTWSQIWTQFQNMAIQAFRPVLARINQLANAPEFAQMRENMVHVLTELANAALTALEWIAQAASWAYENWSLLEPVVIGLAAAVAAYTVVQWAMNLAMLACPVTWIILGIGLIIVALVALANCLGGIKIAWMMYCDLLITGWSYVVWGIQAGIVAVLNFLDDFTLKWSQVSVGVQDFMGQMKVGVLTILQNMINGAISMINSFIALLNNLPGVNIAAISGVTFATEAALEESVSSATRNIGLGLETAAKAGTKAQRFGSLGQKFQDIQTGHQQRQMEIMAERLKKGLNAGVKAGQGVANTGAGGEFSDIYQAANLGGLGGTVGDIGDSVGGGLGSDVADIKKEVSLAQEDLKSLVDMAARRYVNNVNLMVQSPVVQVSGQNTGDTELDRQALANAMRDIIVEQAASASLRSTAQVR